MTIDHEADEADAAAESSVIVPGASDETASDDTASPDGTTTEVKDGERRRAGQISRSLLYAPHGDGQTRRRGSDATRVALSVLAVLVCWVAVKASSHTEHAIAKFLSAPPNGVSWLVTAVWWGGTAGVIAVLAVLALFTRRWQVIRDVLFSATLAFVIAETMRAIIGADGGRPPDASLQGINLGFPVVWLAVATAVVLAMIPYLSRWLQLSSKAAVALASLAGIVHGAGMPVAVLASLALGWGCTAAIRLIFGSPVGLPSVAEVLALLDDLDIAATAITPYARQEWGVGRFSGRVGADTLNVSIYGRDASDAQILAKTFRFLLYRDSGPTLALTRRQQVEHEALLTMTAQRIGARVPDVVAAGPAGPANDAVLVTIPPKGRLLSSFTPYPTAEVDDGAASGADGRGGQGVEGVEGAEANDGSDPLADPSPSTEVAPSTATDPPIALEHSRTIEPSASTEHAVAEHAVAEHPVTESSVTEPIVVDDIDDPALDSIFAQVRALRAGGIAHGSISTETIVVDGRTAGLISFRTAAIRATQDQLDRDIAAALAAAAIIAGPTRTAAAAIRVLSSADVAAGLPFLQRAALDPVATRTLRQKKALLGDLRNECGRVAGVEVPKLIEPRRISWVNFFMVIGTLIGGWALIGVLTDVSQSWSTIQGADWGWVAVTFILAQSAYPAIAVTTVGSVTTSLPYGRTLALEMSDTFVALAGGSMAVLATRIRYFQKQGFDATIAVSSGVLVSTASWIVKGALFLIAIPFAISSLNFSEPTSTSDNSHQNLVWIIVLIIVLAGVVIGLALAIPRWRRLAAAKIRPKVSEVWDHLKILSAHPRNLVEIFGGNVVAQIVIALALGTALHAFNEHLGLATILVVLTLSSMLGGMSPVPGGMGIVEAGMIIGLQAAGIPQPEAVAATFVQRLFTAYLPPIWGWFVLVWLRRKDYL